MLFNSFSYLLFLPAVVALYWIMPPRLRKTFLLLASYFFYMSWRPAYGLLILILTVVNYGFGLLIARTAVGAGPDSENTAGSGEKSKLSRVFLILGLIFNLGALCYFKYTNFLLESVFTGLASIITLTHSTALQNWDQPVLKIILPLGISFFTFEFIHYIVDVYRGSKPVKNFVDFALFASFFPSQIAGPIKRFQDFMQQMGAHPAFQSQQFRQGTFLILQGLFKKVVLGDNLSPIVGRGFTNCGEIGLVDAWLAVIGFSYQLYFDFSGYTDIGRGSALLLGYKVPENFNLPFLAANLTDFWRRWHISLSSWLRDYLFISLGGSRGSAYKTKRNLILTMVLGGLWHGAAWHFVIWGAVHGFGLTVFKDWSQFIAGNKHLAKLQKLRAWHIAGVVATNIFVYLAFAVFRASTLMQAQAVISKFFGIGVNGLCGEVVTLFVQSPLTVMLPAYFLYFLCRQAITRENHLAPMALDERKARPIWSPIVAYWEGAFPLRLVTYAAVLVTVIACAPSQYSPFIYFQF
jgi:alginate O-acetyltransferase complex protein AlgI